MSNLGTMPAPPDLPFTLEPGDTPARSTLALVRARWWVLGVFAVLAIGAGAVRGGLRGAILAAVGVSLLIVGVAVTVFVAVRIVSGHRITVTHSGLIVDRVRRRTLPRADAGELVVGFFTVRALDPAGLQACFTNRHGKRFATTTLITWPPGGLLQVASALGIDVRDQDPERDRRLVPFWIRHPFLFQLHVGVAILVIVLGIVMTLMALA